VSELIREGDLIFVRGPEWLRGVVWFYHVALAIEARGELSSIEAMAGGVTVYPMHHWGRRYVIARPKGATVEQGRIAADAAWARRGERYGYRQWGGMAWRTLLRLLGLEPARLKSLAVACSPLAQDAWHKAGWHFTDYSDPLPDEIWDSVEWDVIGEYGAGRR